MNRSSIFRAINHKMSQILGSHSQPQVTTGEQKLCEMLRQSFPKATEITVQDISGGCGAMYEVAIESEEFAGKSRVNQHRMVNEAIKEEIKDMHGLRISTRVPSQKNQ